MSFFEYFKNFSSTGTLFSSSKGLAKKNLLIFDFLPIKENYKILEVGPATGALTIPLLNFLKKEGLDYSLDLIELNSSFYNTLKNKYDENNNIKIYNKSILDFSQNDDFLGYDLIISSLPFNSFPVEFNEAVMDKFKSLSHNDTIISFYEYLMVTKYKNLINKEHRFWYENLSTGIFYEQVEWFNIPPARIRFLKIS